MADGAHPDRGFTLVEVIVVITLLALISSVMTAVVAVVVRTEGPTTDRTINASSLRGLETWLSHDVVGVAPGGFDLSTGATTGCDGASPGMSLVRLTWTEQTPGGGTTFIANYRFEDDAAVKVIRRYTCSGSGSGPFGNVASVKVTRALAPVTPVVTAMTDGADIVGVRITVQAATGTTLTAASASRNPSATLDTTTTSTVAPPPCTVLATNLPLSEGNESETAPAELDDDVTLTFSLGGTCGALSLQFDRDDGDGVQTVPLTGTFPNLTVVLDEDDEWNDGPHTMTVLNGSVPLAPTSVFTVT